MNTQNKNLITLLSKEATTQLTTIVSETLAFESKEVKTFTAADLWNIQRQKKGFTQRRYNAA